MLQDVYDFVCFLSYIIGWFCTSPNPISETEDITEIAGFESLDLSLEIGFPLSTNCCTEGKKKIYKRNKDSKDL